MMAVWIRVTSMSPEAVKSYFLDPDVMVVVSFVKTMSPSLATMVMAPLVASIEASAGARVVRSPPSVTDAAAI